MYLLARLTLLLAALLIGAAFGVLAVLLHPWPLVFVGLYVVGKAFRKTGRYLWIKGTAAWATYWDIQRAGGFSGSGLMVGRVKGYRPSLLWATLGLLGFRHSREACLNLLCSLRLKKPEDPLVRVPERVPHVAVFAMTGAGKGVSLMVPYLLGCPDSMIVHDTKLELFQITAKTRRKMGHRCVLLAPFAGRGDKLNPLDFIDSNSEQCLDDIRDLAKALVVRAGTEHEPHWNDNAEIFIGAMIAFVVCFCERQHRNLQSVRTLLTHREKMEKAIGALCESDKFGGLLSRWGHQLKLCQDKELASVLSTANRHLSFLDTPAIRDATSASTFNPADFRRQKMTLFFGVGPDHMAAQMGFLRMVVTTCLRAVVKQGLGGNTVRLLLDEVASLGRLDQLADVLDKFRGYSVRGVWVYQDMGQLKKCWPDEGQSLLSNTAHFFFAVNDPNTAEFVVKRLGEATVLSASGSRNWGGNYSAPEGMRDGGTRGKSWGESENWGQEARPLMTAAEVMTVDERLGLLFLPSTRPIAVGLVRYYEEPHLFRRPGFIRRFSRALGVLLASGVVCCLAAGIAFGAAVAMENRDQFMRNTPREPDVPDIFGGRREEFHVGGGQVLRGDQGRGAVERGAVPAGGGRGAKGGVQPRGD